MESLVNKSWETFRIKLNGSLSHIVLRLFQGRNILEIGIVQVITTCCYGEILHRETTEMGREGGKGRGKRFC